MIEDIYASDLVVRISCATGILNYFVQFSLFASTIYKNLIWNRTQNAAIET